MRRHTGIWLLFVFGLLELGLALLQGFSGALSRWFTDQTQGIAFFIGLQLTILFTYLGLRHLMDAANTLRLEDVTRQLSSRVGQIQFLAEDRFYAEFESRIENAGRSVSISHLDTIPPTRLKGSTAEHYFKRFSDLVRRRSRSASSAWSAGRRRKQHGLKAR